MSNARPYTVEAKYIAPSDKIVHLTYLILCALPLALSFIMSTNGTVNSVHLFGLNLPVRLPCLIKDVTGFNCPTCGMTRSFIYMSHLNFHAAFEMNRAGPLFYLLFLFEVPYRLARLFRQRLPLQRVFTLFEGTLFVVFLAVDLLFFLWQFLRLL